MPAFTNLLTALGWSLLDSIWQMGAVWLAYHILTVKNMRFSAAGKHNLAFMFVAMGSGWIMYSFIHLLEEPAVPIVAGFIPVNQSLSRWIPYLSFIYLLVLIFRSVPGGIYHYRRGSNMIGKPVPAVFQSFTDRHARLMGITRRVHVFFSDMAETAETSGYLKPLILMPVSLVTRLSPLQLEAILIHELFHIRRNDYLVNICMSCFRSIFFFNPFAHLFYKAIARERELACDDGVLERGYAPSIYAEALFSLEKFRQVHPGFSIAADGNKPWLLMERIRRVLGKPVYPKTRFDSLVFFSMVTAVLLFGLQQKTITRQTGFVLMENKTPVVQDRHETFTEPIKSKGKEITSSRRSIIRKTVRKPVIQHEPPVSNPELTFKQKTPELAYFAQNNIIRDYSNQSATAPVYETIHPYPESPYVPSASFSYEALPIVMEADSLREIAMETVKQQAITAYCLETTTKLELLEKEIEKNRKQLSETEHKNRKYILMDKKNIKPLLEKMHNRINLNKREIEHLQIQLQMTCEEIIHI